MHSTEEKKETWVLIQTLFTSWVTRAESKVDQLERENPEWLVGLKEYEPGRYMISVYEKREE